MTLGFCVIVLLISLFEDVVHVDKLHLDRLLLSWRHCDTGKNHCVSSHFIDRLAQPEVLDVDQDLNCLGVRVEFYLDHFRVCLAVLFLVFFGNSFYSYFSLHIVGLDLVLCRELVVELLLRPHCFFEMHLPFFNFIHFLNVCYFFIDFKI